MISAMSARSVAIFGLSLVSTWRRKTEISSRVRESELSARVSGSKLASFLP